MRIVFFTVPLLLAAILATCPRPAVGCAVVLQKDGSTSIDSELAVIIHDSATKTEHFIRSADFRSTSNNFGFLVPTPTKPELAEASAELFSALIDITKRRTIVEYRAKELKFGCAGSSALPSDVRPPVKVAGKDSDSVRTVQVVEQKRVGDYDAVVLRATDPLKLRVWLTTNGYDTRPELDEWFAEYTKNDWYLTAFKISSDRLTNAGNKLAVSSPTVRISFQTDRPFYPYREPADMRTNRSSRKLQLFVLSDSRVSGTVGDKPWDADTEWSNKINAEQVAKVVNSGQLPESVGNRAWHLTELLDFSSPRQGTAELYFGTAADQSNVERTPLVIHKEYDPWPWVFGCIAVLAAVLLGFRMRKSMMKKPA
jgi:hypothetical protein